jgi:hypothetical protein
VKSYGVLKNVPPDKMGNLRNDMYVVSENAEVGQDRI